MMPDLLGILVSSVLEVELCSQDQAVALAIHTTTQSTHECSPCPTRATQAAFLLTQQMPTKSFEWVTQSGPHVPTYPCVNNHKQFSCLPA
eukprot:6276642-Amphidinium_carterae.1